MKSVLPLILIFLLGNCSLTGQSNKDELMQKILISPDDTSKVWMLAALSEQYRRISVDSMIYFLEEAMMLSEKIDFTSGQLEMMHRLANRYHYKGDGEKEKVFLQDAIQFSEQLESKKYLEIFYFALGNHYAKELKYDSAYNAYMTAENMFPPEAESYYTWNTNFGLFKLFVTQDEPEKAMYYLQRAYEITKEKGIRKDFGWILFQRAGYLFNKKDWGNYAAASEEYMKFLKNKDNSKKSPAGHNILFMYTGEKETEEIIAEIEALIPFHEKRNYQLSLADAYNYLAGLKRDIGDYEGAIEDYKKTIPLVQKLNFDAVEADCYEYIYKIYELQNNHEKAFPYLKKYHLKIDSLNSVEVQNNMNELEVKYELAEKDKALAQNQLELERSAQAKKVFIILAIAGSLLALVAFWFLYFKNKTNRLLTSQKLVIQKALNEKEILLKEIHHRVKNNLQVISSLLNWQSKYIEDHQALKSMQEGRNRVQSMALIHQNLYQSDNLTGVEVTDYIDKLSNSLFKSYNIRQDQIRFQSNIQPLTLDVDTLIPLGLILNELLSNALKHAFPDGRSGEIAVNLRKEEDTLILEVNDDGVGMQAKSSEQTKESFGYKLVEAFAEKLKAKLSIESDVGTSIKLLIQNFKMA